MAFNIFCRAALRGEPITVYGDGRQTRDFTYVGDVVAATRAAAASPELGRRVFNVGGGSRAALRDAIQLIAEFNGQQLDVRYLPMQHGDVRDTSADIALARADLGYSPTTPLADGLRDEFDWVRSSVGRAQIGS
jgi:UDP-glucose 4-epimerase